METLTIPSLNKPAARICLGTWAIGGWMWGGTDEQESITTIAYGALCRGLLSGKMSSATTFQGDDLRKSDPKFQQPLFQDYLNAVHALDEFAKINYQKNVLALAVRWVLDKGHTIALWGARHPSQLANINDVMGWTLDKNAMQQIDKIIDQHVKSPVGPEFMAPPP